jgi:hypothetical protein
MQTKRVKNKCTRCYAEFFLSLFGKRAKASVEGLIWKPDHN